MDEIAAVAASLARVRRERRETERMVRVRVFPPRERGFCSAEIAAAPSDGVDGSDRAAGSLGPLLAQAGEVFPGPGPGCARGRSAARNESRRMRIRRLMDRAEALKAADARVCGRWM